MIPLIVLVFCLFGHYFYLHVNTRNSTQRTRYTIPVSMSTSDLTLLRSGNILETLRGTTFSVKVEQKRTISVGMYMPYTRWLKTICLVQAKSRSAPTFSLPNIHGKGTGSALRSEMNLEMCWASVPRFYTNFFFLAS